MMKKLMTVCLLLLTSGVMMAQTNPKEGYIITNGNDTIRGTIDYRADKKNVSECLFCAKGEDIYKRYLPGEIKSYSFDNDGILYVTRTIPFNNVDKTVFAECLLQGCASLYYCYIGDDGYYVFTDEDGQVATMKDDCGDFDNYEEEKAAKRSNTKDAVLFFKKSPKAVNQLLECNYNRRQLISITRTYNQEYCQAGTASIQFEENTEKAATITINPLIEAGIAFGNAIASDANYVEDMDMNGAFPIIGVGAVFSFPRFLEGLSVEGKLCYSYWNVKEEGVHSNKYNQWNCTYTLKAHTLDIILGVKYRFLAKKTVSPFVGLGIDFMSMPSYKSSYYYVTTTGSSGPIEWSLNRNGVGFICEVGVDYRIGKHTIRLSADCVPGTGSMQDVKASRFSVKAGFVL